MNAISVQTFPLNTPDISELGIPNARRVHRNLPVPVLVEHAVNRGEAFAMPGARRVHGIVAGNVLAALKSRQGASCMVFIENMTLRVADDALSTPDVFVTCDARDLRTEMVFEHPTLIVEVLSESTQAFDRGAKFAAYRSLASLREYLLIDPDLRTVELFRRNAAGLF